MQDEVEAPTEGSVTLRAYVGLFSTVDFPVLYEGCVPSENFATLITLMQLLSSVNSLMLLEK